MEDHLNYAGTAVYHHLNQSIDAENCNDGYIDMSHNIEAASFEGGSGEDGSSTNSSPLSAFINKYPDLPRQLKEILDLQNFRIQNMKAEVNTLKEQNAAQVKALEE